MEAFQAELFSALQPSLSLSWDLSVSPKAANWAVVLIKM